MNMPENVNGYGGMAYSCEEGRTSDYALSSVKYVVDNWMNDKTNKEDLKEDKTGYKVRLITYDELINLGYDPVISSGEFNLLANENVPTWVYNRDYDYWTMSAYSATTIWTVRYYGGAYVGNTDARGVLYTIRPVITLKKSAVSEIKNACEKD